MRRLRAGSNTEKIHLEEGKLVSLWLVAHTFGKSLIPLKIQKGAKVKTRDLFTFTPGRPAHLRPKIPDWLEMMNVLNQTGQIVQLPLKPRC